MIDGIDALTFEDRQQLLRIVVERVVVSNNSVSVETVIPSDNQHAGLLCTCHPELDSGSLSTRNQPRGTEHLN